MENKLLMHVLYVYIYSQAYLLQINILCWEPFAAEHNHRSTQTIHATLIKATNAGDLIEILNLCTLQQAFVSKKRRQKREGKMPLANIIDKINSCNSTLTPTLVCHCVYWSCWDALIIMLNRSWVWQAQAQRIMLWLVAVAVVAFVVVTADSRQVNVFTLLPSSAAATTALNSRHISICPPHYTYRRVDFESCNRLTLARFHERVDFAFALWSVFVLKHERKCLSDKPNVSQCLLKYIQYV